MFDRQAEATHGTGIFVVAIDVNCVKGRQKEKPPFDLFIDSSGEPKNSAKAAPTPITME